MQADDAYENQLIGAFIFTMGHLAGQRGYGNMVLNLYQQTPLDSIYGDLFLGDAQCVAIEFKRSLSDRTAERRKWNIAGAKAFVEGRMPRGVSMRGHLFAYGGSKSINSQEVWVSMFEEAVFGCGAEAEREGTELNPATGHPQELPCKTLLNDLLPQNKGAGNVHFGVSPPELRAYLRELSQFRLSQQNAGTSDRWLAIAASDSGVQMLKADSLTLLMELLDDPHAPLSTPTSTTPTPSSGPRP